MESFKYNGENITFQLGNGDVMVNATAMARSFGNTPKDNHRIQSACKSIGAITGRRKCLPAELV